jgi:Transposase DDE domain group 1
MIIVPRSKCGAESVGNGPDRTSAATMRANQLRLWFASMAYVLLCALRRLALEHTQFARATCGTIRLKLLKIGARHATLRWREMDSNHRYPTKKQL